VSSGGRKNTICTDTHYRIYAPSAGYLRNNILGHYVIGTAHLDKNECVGSATYGWNEKAEANVASRAAAVWGSAAVVKNAMFMPDGTPTFLLFQNAQTEWQGTHYFNNDGYPTLIHVPYSRQPYSQVRLRRRRVRLAACLGQPVGMSVRSLPLSSFLSLVGRGCRRHGWARPMRLLSLRRPPKQGSPHGAGSWR
jgi:hypothetical protein